jgi:hypothetical protein
MSKDFMSNDSAGSTESTYFYDEYTIEEITIESSNSSYIEVSIADDENDMLDEKSVSRAQEEISRKSTSEGRMENMSPGLDLMLSNRSDGRDSGSAAPGFDVESRNRTRRYPGDGSVLNECIKSLTYDEVSHIRTDSTPTKAFKLRLSHPRLTRELSALTECFKSPTLEAASRYKLGDESPLDYDLKRPAYTRHVSALTTEWLNPSIPSSLLDESHAESANGSLAADILVVPQFTRQVSGLSITSLRDVTQHENEKTVAATSFDLVIPSLPRQLSSLTVTDGFEPESTSHATSDKYPSKSHTPNKPRRTSEAEAFAARFNGRVIPKHCHHVNSFVRWSNHTRLDSVIEGRTSASLNKKGTLAAEQLIRKKRTTQMAVKDADLSSAMEKRTGGLSRIPNSDKKVAKADRKTKETRRNSSHVVKLEKKRRHTFTSAGKTECSTAPASLPQQRISTLRELRSSCQVPHQQQGRKVLISNIKSVKKSPKAPNDVPRRRERNTDTSLKALTKESGKNQGDIHTKKDPPGVRLKYVPSSNASKVTRSTTKLSQSSSCAGQ